MQKCHEIVIVSSFLKLVPAIFDLPGVKVFLSGKINQDPLEKFFGCIRQHGRTNDNPSVLEALQSTQTLRVVNAVRFTTLKGNCRGSERKRKVISLEESDKSLPKRKRVRRKSS